LGVYTFYQRIMPPVSGFDHLIPVVAISRSVLIPTSTIFSYRHTGVFARSRCDIRNSRISRRLNILPEGQALHRRRGCSSAFRILPFVVTQEPCRRSFWPPLLFNEYFRTEEDCRQYLFKMRWPKGLIYPQCGHGEYSYHSTRLLYQCKACKYHLLGIINHYSGNTPYVFGRYQKKPHKKSIYIQFIYSLSKYFSSINSCCFDRIPAASSSFSLRVKSLVISAFRLSSGKSSINSIFCSTASRAL